MTIKKTLTAIAAGTLIFSLTACGSSGDDTETNDRQINGMRAGTAYTLCEWEVEDQLTSPGTAEFSGVTGSNIEQDADQERWLVRGHVDSDNAVGGTVRTEFICELVPTDADNADIHTELI